MILDVGCGFRPKGTVNVDHRRGENPENGAKYRDVQEIPNFVQADGQFLPFKDEVFEAVYSIETIEHVENPFLFLREAVRVSSDRVILTTPHRFTRRINPFHKHHFTITWFNKALRKIGLPQDHFQITITRYSYFPHDFLPLVRLPKNVRVEISKKQPLWKP